MADLRRTIFNFFFHLENEGSANSSQPFNKPEALLVYGAFLMNASRKTSKTISKISQKITHERKRCDKSEKDLMLMKASIAETKARKEEVLDKLNNLKTEIAISKRAMKALNGSIKKAKENQILALANMEETKKIIKQKKDHIEGMKKELAEKQIITQNLISTYENTIERINNVMAENELLEENLRRTNAFAQGALSTMMEEANLQAKNLHMEVVTIKVLNSESRTVESNIAELIRKVNQQTEEKALRKQRIASIDKSIPQFWRYLMDMLIRSKDLLVIAVLRPIQEYRKLAKKKKMLKLCAAPPPYN